MPTENVSSPLQAHGEHLWLVHHNEYHSAVIRLQDASILLWGAPSFSQALATQIALLGQLKHVLICSAQQLGDVDAWQQAFPNCRFWASPGARRQASQQGLNAVFSNDLGASPDPTWSAELDQLLCRSADQEVILYHYASQTLLIEGLLAEPTSLMPRWLGAATGGELSVPKRFLRNEDNRQQSKQAMAYLALLKPQFLLLRTSGLHSQGSEMIQQALQRL